MSYYGSTCNGLFLQPSPFGTITNPIPAPIPNNDNNAIDVTAKQVDNDFMYDPICECDTCRKQDVCKYTDKYREHFEYMSKLTKSLEIDQESIFKCKVQCTKYDDKYGDY